MWDYFVRIERSLYLPEPNPDHGFHGWLGTIGGPVIPSNGSGKRPSSPGLMFRLTL
jgi:hypothetical protein